MSVHRGECMLPRQITGNEHCLDAGDDPDGGTADLNEYQSGHSANEEGVAITRNPLISWLPDLGSNQGPTD